MTNFKSELDFKVHYRYHFDQIISTEPIKKISIVSLGDNFYVDVIFTEHWSDKANCVSDYIELWLYHKNCGIKQFMFGYDDEDDEDTDPYEYVLEWLQKCSRSYISDYVACYYCDAPDHILDKYIDESKELKWWGDRL